jgi:hypothetical protein
MLYNLSFPFDKGGFVEPVKKMKSSYCMSDLFNQFLNSGPKLSIFSPQTNVLIKYHKFKCFHFVRKG